MHFKCLHFILFMTTSINFNFKNQKADTVTSTAATTTMHLHTWYLLWHTSRDLYILMVSINTLSKTMPPHLFYWNFITGNSRTGKSNLFLWWLLNYFEFLDVCKYSDFISCFGSYCNSKKVPHNSKGILSRGKKQRVNNLL